MIPQRRRGALPKVAQSFFGNFWLTIQNTGNWHVSNAFDLLSVFISFPWRAVRPYPTPSPFLGREVPKKTKKKKIVGVGEVAVALCFSGGFGVLMGS